MEPHVTSAYSYTFTCPFAMVLMSGTPPTKYALKGVPLAGTWTFEAKQEKESTHLYLRHDVEEVGRGRAYNGWGINLPQGMLERAVSLSDAEFNPKHQRDYVFELSIKRGEFEAGREEFVSPLHAAHQRSRTTSASSSPLPKEFEYSDDETDEVLLSKRPSSLHDPSDANDALYRQVVVTQASFSTYHAVLVLLQTGFVHFTPLSSSFPTDDFTSRQEMLSEALDEEPLLPLPVSPVSAYRLARLLQLPDLQQHCLGAIQYFLTVRNAGTELFREPSITYEDLRRVIIVWIVASWSKVKKEESWKDMTGKMRRDEVPGAAAVFPAVGGVGCEG
ncbi:hypothetical protein JCM8547_004980 [Rhodosporidiobolus lusitaniae]